MGSRFLRFFTLAIQTLLFLGVGMVCIYGIVVLDNVEGSYQYIASVTRAGMVFVVAIAYYKTSVTNTRPGNPFIRSFLLFNAVLELRILTFFTELTGWSFIPPRVSVRIEIVSQFIMMLCLILYAVYYTNTDHGRSLRFLLLGIAAMVFMGITVPAPQGISETWSLAAPLGLFLVLGAVALISNIIIAVTEPSLAGTMKQLAILTMAVGNFISVVFGSFLLTIIGTAVFVIGGVIAMILTLRNSVIL